MPVSVVVAFALLTSVHGARKYSAGYQREKVIINYHPPTTLCYNSDLSSRYSVKWHKCCRSNSSAKGTAIKWLLLTYCHIHRSMLHSTHMKGAAFYSDENYQRLTTEQHQESETFVDSILNGIFIKCLPPRLRDLYGRGGRKTEKILRARDEEYPQRNCLSNRTGLMHIWSHSIYRTRKGSSQMGF